MTAVDIYDSPLGPLGIAAGPSGICHVAFEPIGPRDDGPGEPWLEQLRGELDRYFAGQPVEFGVAVDLREASEFERRVLTGLREVHYGQTISYGELTAAVGLPPTAARQVGQVMGGNPIPLVIGCHRVIGADGALVGFGGGLWRKRALLDLESAHRTPRLF